MTKYETKNNNEPTTTITSEQFDYTKWQQEYFSNITPNELNEKVADFAKTYTFKGNPNSVLK